MLEKGLFRFSKKERLSSKTRIEQIFYSGDAFIAYPFRVILQIYDKDIPDKLPSILISIPKKRLKRAVDRNRMKRLTKEVYRLNRSLLFFENVVTKRKQIDISFVYVGNNVQTYEDVEKGVLKALREINYRFKNLG